MLEQALLKLIGTTINELRSKMATSTPATSSSVEEGDTTEKRKRRKNKK